ncbi:sugar-binding domain-containing protein, partial [Streptomyces sp. MCAF7]
MTLKTAVDSPRQWTAEAPHLYRVEVALRAGDRRTVHRVDERFGFRTVEVRPNDGVYVNGVRILLKGANRHTFTAPAHWRDRRVFLVFEGSMTDTEAWINGESAGPVHRGGFYRFRHEVTGKLRPGQGNLLEVTVSKESADDSVNRAERLGDYWNFGGIYRPVHLEAFPLQHIERIAVDARADGTLRIDAH